MILFSEQSRCCYLMTRESSLQRHCFLFFWCFGGGMLGELTEAFDIFAVWLVMCVDFSTTWAVELVAIVVLILASTIFI